MDTIDVQIMKYDIGVEVVALRQILEALAPFDEKTQYRILDYVIARFNLPKNLE